MRKLRIFLLLFFSLLAVHAAEQEAALRFSEANKAYRSGNYTAASKVYESILAQGLQSGVLYYNLGNCYFKSGEFANAILAFERAKKFMPDDEDVAYNLRLAYSNTVDKIEPVPQLFYQRWWADFLNFFSPTIWAIIAISLLWIAGLLAAWYLYAGTVRSRKYTFLGSASVFILAVLLFVVAGSSYARIKDKNSAIVIESSAVIRSSPDEKSTTLFMLHAGTKIEVLDELGAWQQIRIANGNSGWIPSAALEKI